MQRPTQSVVALGASVVLGVVAGVLVSSSGTAGRIGDPTAPSGGPSVAVAPTPFPSPTPSNPVAVGNAPNSTATPRRSPTGSGEPTTPTASPEWSPSADDRQGRGRGRDSDGQSGNDDDEGEDG